MTNSGYEMQLAEKDDRIAELGAKLAKAQELVEHRQIELASVMRANDNKFNTIQRLNAELAAAIAACKAKDEALNTIWRLAASMVGAKVGGYTE